MTPFQKSEMEMFDEDFDCGNGTGVMAQTAQLKSWLLSHDTRLIEEVIGMVSKMKGNGGLEDADYWMGRRDAIDQFITELEGYKNTKI